jgi:hypothetical protein
MRCETKCFRRGTLRIVGLGWMPSELEGSKVVLNMQTGALEGDPREEPRVPRLSAPEEQAKTTADHVADLFGDPPAAGDAAIAGLIAQIEAAIASNGGNLAQWYTWGVRTFHKDMAAWGLAEYERLLAAIRATAERYRTQVASQEPAASHEEAPAVEQPEPPPAQGPEPTQPDLMKLEEDALGG